MTDRWSNETTQSYKLRVADDLNSHNQQLIAEKARLELQLEQARTQRKRSTDAGWAKMERIAAIVVPLIGVISASSIMKACGVASQGDLTRIERRIESLHAEFDLMIERDHPGAVNDMHRSIKSREE